MRGFVYILAAAVAALTNALKVAVKKIGKAARKSTIPGPCRDALLGAIATLRQEIAALS